MLKNTMLKTLVLRFGRPLLLMAAITTTPLWANSQTSTTTGPLDKRTPLALAPGAPAGSQLEDLATVNLFNGHLNFALPLTIVGGRGDIDVPMSLVILRSTWIVSMRCDTTVTGQTVCRRFASSSWWGSNPVGYGPGVVHGRGGGRVVDTAVVFTFTDPNGTEHEMRDTLTNGQPNTNAVSFNRGTNFASTDGTSITYVSDTAVNDISQSSSPTTANGFLLLPNGTRYRIVQGLVSWIRDRNGNKVSYTYENFNGWRVKTITDSLGRVITVNYDVNDPTYGLCDQIIVPAFNGTLQTITITKGPLASALRYDQPQPQTYGQLFPQITNDVNYNQTFNPPMVTGVYLPNGQSLKFFYNVYGDLARVQIPDGGAVDYDYQGGLTNEPSNGAILGGNYIYRRVITKRIYTNAAALTSLRRVISYSRPETWNASAGKAVSVGYVATEDRAADNTLLGYEKHYFFGVAANTLFSSNPYSAWKDGKEYKTEIFDLNQTTILRRSENEWRQRASVSWWPGYVAVRPTLNINDEPANDPRVVETKDTIEPAGVNLVSKVTSLDPQTQIPAFEGNNQTDTWQYDFGVGAPSVYPRRRDHVDYLSVNPVNNINYSGPANGSAYISTDIHIRSLPRARQVYSVNTTNGSQTLVSQSESRFDELAFPVLTYTTVTSWEDPGSARGNSTTSRNWVNVSNSWLESHTQYDQCGSVRKIWSPQDTTLQNPTELTYSDSFSDGLLRNTFAYPSTVTTPIPDASGNNGSNVGLVTSSVYDFNTGRAVSVTDPNGKTTSYDYTDPLNRLKQVTRPDSGRIRYNYSDVPGDLYVQVLTDIDASHSLESRTYRDGLGRPSREFVYDGTGSTPWVVSDTYYDAVGRVSQESQPYRVGSVSASLPATCNVCFTNVYDVLGRVTTLIAPDSSQVGTVYGANTSGVIALTVTVTDPSGRKRRSLLDVTGRVVRVDEPNDITGNLDVNGTSTSYLYDAVGNLRKITQGGQQRFFMYDSLGRLLRLKNPELNAGTLASNLTDEVTGNTQWSTAYSYDNNGNVISRIDARNITTTYAYDAVDRLKTRSYSDGTPNVTLIYDASNVNNSKGHLTSVSSSVSTYSYGEYDAVGRIKSTTQTIDGVGYVMNYSYNLAGVMTSQSYPSGRVVASEYDDAGRLAGVRNVANGLYYAGAAATDSTNRIQYSPHGAVSQLRLGNTLWEHTNFNSRLQPEQVGLGITAASSSVWRLDYSYGTTNNNGNVQSQTITLPGGTTLTQNYGYDQLNRLTSAQEFNGGTLTWKQGFIYSDVNGQNQRYGNRRIDVSNTTPGLVGDNPMFDAATNRVSPQVGEQYSFDLAGNMTKDKAGHEFVYDAENRQISYNGGDPASGGASYIYDGDGRRVKKLSSAGTFTYIYNMVGQVVAEYTDNPMSSGNATSYLTLDQLGTPRVITKEDGSVIGRHDYLPFGEEIPTSYGGRDTVAGYAASDTLKQKFTLKERDNETGLDYFGARYYASLQGRFTSSDPVIVTVERLVDPQRLNLYAYVRNNPLAFIDPDGADVISIELKSSGPNKLAENNPKWSSFEAGKVQELGPVARGNNFVYAVNIVVTVTPDDSPDNYEAVQKYYVIAPQGQNSDPHRPGVS
ncbi:MAG TPA: RHS repeat-associated core domain-containing protein, partial [Pyrinomonadaceae bacterium]|nr:RHS repeat-associated core domain-containing protein [Pyrinomonadaceae bacterium]